MDEYVRSAVIRFDEAEAFGGIEELNCSDGHDNFLSIGIAFRRLTKCQTPHQSKLRGKIVRRRSAETSSTSKIDYWHIGTDGSKDKPEADSPITSVPGGCFGEPYGKDTRWFCGEHRAQH
jgi:hypothetical protein